MPSTETTAGQKGPWLVMEPNGRKPVIVRSIVTRDLLLEDDERDQIAISLPLALAAEGLLGACKKIKQQAQTGMRGLDDVLGDFARIEETADSAIAVLEGTAP